MHSRFDQSVHGLWPAMPTPLDSDGGIDREACGRIVAHVRNDVDGLWLMGTGAGFASLDAGQRQSAIDAYFDAVDSTLPLMVGISDNSLTVVRENLRALETRDPVAVFCAAPSFYIYDQTDLESYFCAVADDSPFPLVIYNNDTNTKAPLSLDLVASLSQHANIVGLKDSTCNLSYHMQLLDQFHGREDFRIINGDDWGIVYGPAVGTAAFVAAAPLLAPALVRNLKRAVENGDILQARELQRLHTTLLGIYGLRGGTDSGFLAAQAAALHILGLSTAITPAPCRSADEKETAFVREVLEASGILSK